ncbi:MAG TPA: hypothetical protein VIT42_04690 [Microlunatus sp.]
MRLSPAKAILRPEAIPRRTRYERLLPPKYGDNSGDAYLIGSAGLEETPSHHLSADADLEAALGHEVDTSIDADVEAGHGENSYAADRESGH